MQSETHITYSIPVRTASEKHPNEIGQRITIMSAMLAKERYNTLWRIKVAHDTINKVVEKPVEVIRNNVKTETKEVNRLYWWQKVLILLGCASLIDLIVQIYKFWKRK